MAVHIKYEVRVSDDGSKQWYLGGKRHREGGPAYKGSDGTEEWWLNGELHREDGPAVEEADGYKEWWLNGEEITEKEHAERTNSPCPEKTIEIDGVRYKLVPA